MFFLMIYIYILYTNNIKRTFFIICGNAKQLSKKIYNRFSEAFKIFLNKKNRYILIKISAVHTEKYYTYCTISTYLYANSKYHLVHFIFRGDSKNHYISLMFCWSVIIVFCINSVFKHIRSWD